MTLFSLLLFTALGSLASARYVRYRNRLLTLTFVALVVVTICYQVGMPILVHRFVGASLAVRIGLAILVIAPLGVCLGVFVPLGLTTVAAVTAHKEEFVAWSWATNAFFSVMSSILSIILAMIMGFTMLLWCAVLAYFIGISALWSIPAAGDSAEV